VAIQQELRAAAGQPILDPYQTSMADSIAATSGVMPIPVPGNLSSKSLRAIYPRTRTMILSGGQHFSDRPRQEFANGKIQCINRTKHRKNSTYLARNSFLILEIWEKCGTPPPSLFGGLSW
jgi:hypothetical protein